MSELERNGRGQLVIVRGHPKPSALRTLGSRWTIPPKSFLEHLDLPDLFKPGSLPSRPKNTFTVQFISLGFYQSENWSIRGVARRTEKRMVQYVQCLKGLSTSFKSSKERVRQYNLHGNQFFTVEQSASLLVHHMNGKQWPGVFLNDCGRPLAPAPWGDLHADSFFY